MSYHRSYQVFGIKAEQVVHVRDVDRGLACDCTCPHCKSPLVAKKGNKNIHHFAHSAYDIEIEECGYGNQTALHLIAKEILLQERYIMLPELHVYAVATDVNGREHKASEARKPYRLPIDQVIDECVLDGIIPDIIIRSGLKELLVEIAVTNFVNNRKRNWLKQRDKASIEIDLSGYYRSIGRDGEWDIEKLRHMIVDSVTEKTWLHNPKSAEIYQRLLGQAKHEADQVMPNPTFSKKPPEHQPRGEIVLKQGICQICNQFTHEHEWWYFDCATMTCKCNKCLRGH